MKYPTKESLIDGLILFILTLIVSIPLTVYIFKIPLNTGAFIGASLVALYGIISSMFRKS